MAYSNINMQGYEEIEECPYNNSHQILKHRMQTHIVKCKKNYPDSTKVTCTFNSTHHINKQELEYHLRYCPDRANFEKYKNPVESPAFNAEVVNMIPLESEDNWDNINVPTYNPTKYVQNVPVLRSNNGLTPSERKAFKKAEHLRISNLKN